MSHIIRHKKALMETAEVSETGYYSAVYEASERFERNWHDEEPIFIFTFTISTISTLSLADD